MLICIVQFAEGQNCPFPQPHSYATPSSGLFYGQATINQQVAEAADIILAYDPDGNLAGSSAIIQSGSIAYISLLIYGDDNATTTIDEGMGSGDNYFTLRLYDYSEDNYMEIVDGSGNPIQFTGWANYNASPIPAYSDFTSIYDFMSIYCSASPDCNLQLASNEWVGPPAGYWNESPGYWSLGHLPTNCDHVVIPPGYMITVRDGFIARGYTLEVNLGGELIVNEEADFLIEANP